MPAVRAARVVATSSGRSAVALVNAAIITGTGRDPFDGAVVVEGDRIVDVVEGGTVRSGVDVSIDCRGRSLLPGLIDAHVHIGAWAGR